MRPKADPHLIQWIDHHPANELFISAITRGEIERGLNLMPRGKRRAARQAVAEGIFNVFAGRCLAFEEMAAIVFGRITAQRITSGRPISVEDAQIAAIALVHQLKLATRNVRDFENIEGLEVVNPWTG
jgi:predicted nucleic acid-binding protein